MTALDLLIIPLYHTELKIVGNVGLTPHEHS